MSWRAATGAEHVFLAGTEQAKSLVDLTDRTVLSSESLSVLVLIAPSTDGHRPIFVLVCGICWDLLGMTYDFICNMRYCIFSII